MATKKALVAGTLAQNIANADTLLVGSGIDANATGALAIGASTATSVVVTPSVGVGASPVEKLTVAGNIQLTTGADRSISVGNPTGAVNGNHLTLQAADGGSLSGRGGNVIVEAGDATDGSGGSLFLLSGDRGGVISSQGVIFFNSSSAQYPPDYFNLFSTYKLLISGSDLYFDSASNRTIGVFSPTVTDTAGKDLSIEAGSGYGTANGGNLSLSSGTSKTFPPLGSPSSTGSGGDITITAGDGGVASGSGGSIILTAGNGSGILSGGGSVIIDSGTGNLAGNVDIGAANLFGAVNLGNSATTSFVVSKSRFFAESAIHYTGIVSPASLGANQNNYSIGVGGAVYRLTSSVSVNITGLTNGLPGRMIYVINIGANNIVLQNQNAGSSVENRIITGTGADLTLGADDVATLIYDNISARWRVVSVRQ